MTMRLLAIALLCATTVRGGESQSVNITPTLVLPSMSGADIFRYYCATCHGRDARGKGPIASALKTPPTNLTRLAVNNHGEFPADRVKRLITEGRSDAPAHGSSEMPVWGPIFQSLDASDTIAQSRIDNLVAYLKSIQAR